MAENASTVFNVHMPEFVDAICVALRDPTLAVREKVVETLCACVRVIEKRETRWCVQWNTGEFIMSRYREVAEIALRYLEHRDRLVRLSITSLLPQTNYLTICMNHIPHVLKIPAECASGFIALGEMAGSLDGELSNYLETITSHLGDVDRAALILRRLVEEEAPDLSGEAFARFMDHLYERITTFLDTLGHLARSGGAMTADEMEHQVALRDPTLAIREKVVEAFCACLRGMETHETRWRVQCRGALEQRTFREHEWAKRKF
ncbi:hypothetical protein MTR67_039123 [Solanum verrucosum]|uniref:Uncharacterized protein n=1 Tax=Solanum verrucosum TaxID=315347 RepID=A0AAF0ZQ41_SOLVR|nr:hypothetical protein MTR67_039123 [Solanum verrucosum]